MKVWISEELFVASIHQSMEQMEGFGSWPINTEAQRRD